MSEQKGSLSIDTLRKLNALLDQITPRGSAGKLAFARVQAEIEAAIQETEAQQSI